MSDGTIWNEVFGTEFSSIQFLFKDQMFALDNPESNETQEIIEQAMKSPEDFVLKTQREGGGNNYFGNDIPYILSNTDNLSQYSLMRKINPKEFEGVFLRKNKVYTSKCVSEIGIFGTLLVKHNDNDEDNEIVNNKDTGFLLRTKGSGTNEGGVYGGYSFIDCVYFK